VFKKSNPHLTEPLLSEEPETESSIQETSSRGKAARVGPRAKGLQEGLVQLGSFSTSLPEAYLENRDWKWA
jgi:hypothetical protein